MTRHLSPEHKANVSKALKRYHAGKVAEQVKGKCVACGQEAFVKTSVYEAKGRVICSVACGNSLRGKTLTPQEFKPCGKCGRNVGVFGMKRHESACFTTLAEFAEVIKARHTIDSSTGCVLITGQSSHMRYPHFAGRRISRMLVEILLGRALAGFPSEICCHTCDNPKCVNWWHLWAGSQADNMADMTRKNRGRGRGRGGVQTAA